MNKLVSVIVPVYNVEKYLTKCIESIINQNYKNIELILVDDGSSDNSGNICDRFTDADSRVKVYHNKNFGLSFSRNFGIEKSSGEYLIFIDSDDWIEKDYIEYLTDTICKYNGDLVISRLCDTNNRNLIYKNTKLENIFMSKEEVYENILLQKKFDVSACGKIYKRSMFDTIRYPVGELYEDFQIIEQLIEKSKKIIYTTYIGYYYYIRIGSITHSPFSKKYLVLITSSEKLVSFIQKNYPRLYHAALRRYIYSNFVILGIAINSNGTNKTSKKIRYNILKNIKFIFHCKYFALKDKIATIILLFGLFPYKIFLNLYKKMQHLRGK